MFLTEIRNPLQRPALAHQTDPPRHQLPVRIQQPDKIQQLLGFCLFQILRHAEVPEKRIKHLCRHIPPEITIRFQAHGSPVQRIDQSFRHHQVGMNHLCLLRQLISLHQPSRPGNFDFSGIPGILFEADICNTPGWVRTRNAYCSGVLPRHLRHIVKLLPQFFRSKRDMTKPFIQFPAGEQTA